MAGLTFEEQVLAQLGLKSNIENTDGTVLDAVANGENPARPCDLVEVKSGSYVRAGAQIRAQLAHG